MKYAKILMALLAVCLLTIPAFSMPDFAKEKMNSEGQKLIGDGGQYPNPCDCQDPNAPIGSDGRFGPKSMMDGRSNKKNNRFGQNLFWPFSYNFPA